MIVKLFGILNISRFNLKLLENLQMKYKDKYDSERSPHMFKKKNLKTLFSVVNIHIGRIRKYFIKKPIKKVLSLSQISKLDPFLFAFKKIYYHTLKNCTS